MQARLAKAAGRGSPALAKHIVRGLCAIDGSESQAVEAVFKVCPCPSTRLLITYQVFLDQLSVDSPRLPTALAGLGYISLLAPLLFDTEQKRVVVDFVVKSLLMKTQVGLWGFLPNTRITLLFDLRCIFCVFSSHFRCLILKNRQEEDSDLEWSEQVSVECQAKVRC